MADTGRCEPLVNGNVEAMDDEEKAKIRPADIDADVREMERRKRVEMVMNSRLFREELERIIDTQMKDGNGPSGLLQQLSEMMGVGHGRPMQARSGSCVAPINDIRGVESMGYAKGEKILRCKLAAVFRLMDLYGWTHGIGSQITARLNQEQELFLVNPFGVLFNEVTASSLVKLDMQAAVVEQGTTNFGVNAGAFLVHSALYAARPDVKCVVHVVTPSVLSVSALKAGLLPLCQEAAVLGEASVHHYSGGALGPEGRDKMARDLGPVNKVLLLSNHGALCCGETVEEAFFHVYNLALACDTQMKLLPLGVDNLVLMGDEARKAAFDAARRAPDAAAPPADAAPATPRKEKQWRVGATHFEALMRMLDNAGFRTGYVYRSPLIRAEPPRPRNDIELPPAVASLGYLFDEDDKNGPWRKYVDGRKTHDRTRWLNSPNVYQKVEILETGTPDPRKITKWVESNAEEWVADGSPTHSSTPVKIDSALQFVPKNTHPREFKKLQQQIKDNRRADKITSGPQSHILEGVSWEEAKKLQDAGVTQAGEQVILVGAASKGIIQRGFQHNATVYKTPYAKNPFDAVTDDDLEEYKRSVQRHTKGGESFEEEQSESEALSSSLRRGLASPNTASETEEESRDEPRVLRIETKLVPRASQAEVVLSDAADFPDSGFERSKSLRHSGQAASGGRSAGDFFRSFSLGPAQRKKGGRHERAKPRAVRPPTTSRPPLHFHVARLSAAPRVLHTSRLPQTGHGLTLSNPGNRRTKTASSVAAKPNDSCKELRCKGAAKSVVGNGDPAVVVPLKCSASPDNPFNGLGHLDECTFTVKPVSPRSSPVCNQTTNLVSPVPSPSSEVVVPNVILESETDATNDSKDHTYTAPSPNPNKQLSGLTRSQHLKLLKLRFLELYPPAEKSAIPSPAPPKPSHPVSREFEGYWSTSMTSLVSINPLDQSRLNRDFDAKLGLLEFSPMVVGDQVPPALWDLARVERCSQGLAEELKQIDDLLAEIRAEGLALRDQLLDLLPGGLNGDDEDGEETLCEESANYLDAEVSILKILGLDETSDGNRVGFCYRKNLCVPDDDGSNACVLVDTEKDVLLDKTRENTIGILSDDVDENRVNLSFKGNDAEVGIPPEPSGDLLVLADKCPKENEFGFGVDQHPFDPKAGIFGGMDSTVDFIDASLVCNAQTEDVVEIVDLRKAHIGTVDEDVESDDHLNEGTNSMQEARGDFVDAQAASQNKNDMEHACKNCTDDVLVVSTDKKELGEVNTYYKSSNESDAESEDVEYEIITLYDKESVEKEIVGASEEDVDTNSGNIDEEVGIVVSIATTENVIVAAYNVAESNYSTAFEEGLDTGNNNVADNFVANASPAQSDLIEKNIADSSFSDEENVNTSNGNIEVQTQSMENNLTSKNHITDTVMSAKTSTCENSFGALHRPVRINLPHLESMIRKSNHKLVDGTPSLDGSIQHWPSLENGMCNAPEPDCEFDIAEYFPDPVRPLQYDDEEYIKKPLRPKKVFHDTEDEEEEEVVVHDDKEVSHGTDNEKEEEEEVVDDDEVDHGTDNEKEDEEVVDDDNDDVDHDTDDEEEDEEVFDDDNDDVDHGTDDEEEDEEVVVDDDEVDHGTDDDEEEEEEVVDDDDEEEVVVDDDDDEVDHGTEDEDEDEEVVDHNDIVGQILEEAIEVLTELKESVENVHLCYSLDDGGDDKHLIDEVGVEEFFSEVEEEIDKILAEGKNLSLSEGDKSECSGDEHKNDNKNSIMKPKLEPGSDLSDVSLNDLFRELSDCEGASAAVFADNECKVHVKEELEEDKLCEGEMKAASDKDCMHTVHFKTAESYQPKTSREGTPLAAATNTMTEGFPTSFQVLRKELPDNFGFLNIGGDKTDPDIQIVDTFQDSPQNSMNVINSKYAGEDDHCYCKAGSNLPSVIEILTLEGEEFLNGDDSDLSEYLHNGNDSNPDIDEIDIDSEFVYNYDESTEQSPNPGPAAIPDAAAVLAVQRLSTESGGGDAANLYDPLDVEVCHLNNSFITIENLRNRTHSCCLHSGYSSSDTGSTNEGTDFTSPSDGEYEDDMPPVAMPQLSQSCRSVLETPLHFSFHIRDENNKSLELPPSPRTVAESVVVATEGRQTAVVQELEVAVQDIEILVDMAIASPVAVEEKMGFHGQGESPEDVKPTDVQYNCGKSLVKVEKQPETICFEDINVEEANADVDPLAEANISPRTSRVLASSSYQPDTLWPLVSYTEYEPIGNSTTTSQLDVDGVTSIGPDAALAGFANETDGGSTVSSPFVSCGDSSQSALSSHFMLSSPDSYQDVFEGDPQDNPPLSPTG